MHTPYICHEYALRVIVYVINTHYVLHSPITTCSSEKQHIKPHWHTLPHTLSHSIPASDAVHRIHMCEATHHIYEAECDSA